VIKRILVGLGGTPYTSAAIQHAVELAKNLDAELTGVTAVNVKRLANVGPVPIGASHAAKETVARRIRVTRAKIEEAISKFESACTVDRINYRVAREEGKDPFDLMISVARYHDLMIFGLRSIFEYDISYEEPKDTLARLISAGVRPIVAVSDTFQPIQRVLIAYSGSMESAKAMKRFCQMRLWPDAALKVVTIQNSEDNGRQLLHDATEYCQAHGFTVDSESKPGSPKSLILPMANQWQADMIVLGNSARNLLVKQVLRETALHTIRNADKPLFLCQ